MLKDLVRQAARLLEDETMPSGTIRIRGTDYKYTSQMIHDKTYILKSPKGAEYATLRKPDKKELMVLISYKTLKPVQNLKGVWLTDKDGELKVALDQLQFGHKPGA